MFQFSNTTKKFLVKFITAYQILLSPIVKQLFGIKNFCRYPISCSEYTKRAIMEYGLMKGSVLGVKRIISCQPFKLVFNHQSSVTQTIKL